MTRAHLVALQPVALAVTQVLGFYAQNVGEFDMADVVRPLALASASTGSAPASADLQGAN